MNLKMYSIAGKSTIYSDVAHVQFVQTTAPQACRRVSRTKVINRITH